MASHRSLTRLDSRPASGAELFDSIARGPGAMLWPFGGAGHRGAFLAQNDALVARADALVVVQAALQSGAIHAASCARARKKPLWVVPASAGMPALAGSLKLLEDGPFAPTSVDRLLGSLGVASAAGAHQGSRGVATGGLIYAIYDCRYNVLDTLSKGHLHVDAIVVQASQSAQAVTAALLTLALENVVVEGPPGLFRRRRAL